ncbi:hypothetical protein [Mycolicibacterium bacteremicum]|uniref:hypothetical protein n=1 Tax=Mycolicibacterium bacteremicum TaxID=564198 RepID=UPI001054C126|nr:hypothetical protein [Mycolicibacterium bacteremicum]MCV7434836.1 hypothetical protein [Mycolicibacterium bacteremicum]
MADQTPEQRILEAIRSWPNHPWLVLPGPVDIAGGLAAHLVQALGLAEHAETVPVFVNDDPPELVWRGLEQVPAQHAEWIPHTRLASVWHSEDCPDCREEHGVHDRRIREGRAEAVSRVVGGDPNA